MLSEIVDSERFRTGLRSLVNKPTEYLDQRLVKQEPTKQGVKD